MSTLVIPPPTLLKLSVHEPGAVVARAEGVTGGVMVTLPVLDAVAFDDMAAEAVTVGLCVALDVTVREGVTVEVGVLEGDSAAQPVHPEQLVCLAGGRSPMMI